eukprot:gene9929-10947_t
MACSTFRSKVYLKESADSVNASPAVFEKCMLRALQCNDTKMTVSFKYTDGKLITCPSHEGIRMEHPPGCPCCFLTPNDMNAISQTHREAGVRVGVAVIVQSSDRRVLITRRSKHLRTFPGVWVPPGGHLEHEETLQQAAFRELQEETGINSDEIQINTGLVLGLWETQTNNGTVCDDFPYSVEIPVVSSVSWAMFWVLILVFSTLLNASAFKLILTQSRLSIHSASLLSIIAGDLVLGGTLFASSAVACLQFNVCQALTAFLISYYILMDISVLSILLIVITQARKAKYLNTFVLVAANQLTGWALKHQLAMIITSVWLYSVFVGLSVVFLLPGSKVWFAQFLLIILAIVCFLVYSLRKVRKVMKGCAVPDQNSAALSNRAFQLKKALRITIMLLSIIVVTWIPFLIAIAIHVSKALPAVVSYHIVLWGVIFTYISPLFNPIALFWDGWKRTVKDMIERNNAV